MQCLCSRHLAREDTVQNKWVWLEWIVSCRMLTLLFPCYERPCAPPLDWESSGPFEAAGSCRRMPASSWTLGCLPAGLLPTGRTSRSGSFGEASGGSEGRKRSGTTRVQAIVPHTTGANRTLLQFEPGDVITVLRPEAQNGWLYGKLEGSSTYVTLLL